MSVLDHYKNRGFECMCGNLRMAARAITRMYDEELAPCGLRASQLAVLWATAALEPASVQSIAQTIAMDQSTLLRNLRLLERAALVSITTGSDRRSRIVRTTAGGRRRFERAMPLWKNAQRRLARALKQRQPGMGARTLLRMARAFG